MRRSSAMTGAMLVLASCTSAAARTEAAAAATAAGTVSAEIYSWGKPVHRWTVTPQGEITYVETVAGATGGFTDYWEVTRRAEAGPRAYAEIVALVAPARAEIGKPQNCQGRIFDGPYGSIRWSGPPAQEVALQSECVAERTGRLFAAERAANERAYALTRGGTEVSRVHHDPENP